MRSVPSSMKLKASKSCQCHSPDPSAVKVSACHPRASISCTAAASSSNAAGVQVKGMSPPLRSACDDRTAVVLGACHHEADRHWQNEEADRQQREDVEDHQQDRDGPGGW